MRRQPRANEYARCPPCVSSENHCGGKTTDHLNQASCDEIHGDGQRWSGHPEIEVARDGEVAGERWILEMSHAWRPHAGLGEPVVQPCSRTVAEIGADRQMKRGEHLQEHEDRADKRERTNQAIAALDRADQHPHGDRKRRGQHPSQYEGHPPCGGESRIRLRQDAEELPLLTRGESFEHKRILPQNSVSK